MNLKEFISYFYNDTKVARFFADTEREDSVPRLNSLEFHRRAEELIQHWDDGYFPAKRGPNGKDSFLKREAYRLLKMYIDAGREGIFLQSFEIAKRSEERPHQKGRRQPNETIRNQPFKLGLYAMFSDSSLTRNKQKLWGDEMQLAYANDVDADGLIGFLYVRNMQKEIVDK